MSACRIPLTRPPQGVPVPGVIQDPEVLEPLNKDAAAMQGSGAIGLVEPRSEGELSTWLQANPEAWVLPQGALTSLTGGATPDRDIVVSTRKLSGITVNEERKTVTVGAGLVLATLQEVLADKGLYYPPAPTHDGASVGGNVATNAAGAATFKYGTTRDWIERVRMVLRNGDILDIPRGKYEVHPGDEVTLVGTRELRIPIPRYESPNLKKSSAGYFVRSPMDFIDLIIGSEGTLGILTEIEARLIRRPNLMTGIVFFPQTDTAIDFANELRDRSLCTRSSSNATGLDVRSIEFFDKRCLALLASENKLSTLHVSIPEDAEACLLFEQELAADLNEDTVVDMLVEASESETPIATNPIADLVSVLKKFGAMETCELALPGNSKRQKELAAVREAIPLAISDWLSKQQKQDPAVHKAAGDMIVPFAAFKRMLHRYYDVFANAKVDVVVFGHISDGNVHPNSLPKNASHMRAAKDALLQLACIAKEEGGCPLSEHGVGKHPLKKAMLAEFWGPEAMHQMRNVKQAFDPSWTLSRGVLFEPT